MVFVMVDSMEEARRIAKKAVEKRLAACVNLVPKIHSVYRWQGEVEEAKEVLMLFKTTKTVWPKLQKRIKKWHPYEVPEIVMLPIDEAERSYLQWIEGSVSI
ncbi:divalent-cation tolerance protein CutA [Hydrogenimonas sp.]